MSVPPVQNDIPCYSVPALEVLNEFHDCSVIVFVEGDDDLIFWDIICRKSGLNDYKIESVGGKEQLLERISLIIDHQAKIIVACDNDHSAFIPGTRSHPLVIKTYGYSIENTMYCPASLNRFIRKMARSINDYTAKSTEWLDNFCTSAYRLLVYDIASHRYAKGVQIFGDSCARFLTSPRSEKLSNDKVDNFISNISPHFSQTEINQCEGLIEISKKELRYLIKGHFMTLGVINWIKKHVGKKQTISLDHLYTGIVDSCSNCSQVACVELKNICDDISNAFGIITDTNTPEHKISQISA